MSELDDLIKKLLNKAKSGEKTKAATPAKPREPRTDELITAAGYSDDEGCMIANAKTMLSDGSFEDKMNCVFHMAKTHHDMKAALACAAVVEVMVASAELLSTVDLRAKTKLMEDVDMEKLLQRRKRCQEIIKDAEKFEQRKSECPHSGALH